MKKQLIENINKINKQRVVIIGDVILDHYQWGQVDRISPEAPVPVVLVEQETYRLGGAANVAKNIKSMGAEPYLVGLVGSDKYGQQLQDLLTREGIPHCLYKSRQRKTTLKTRIMGNSQQIVRIDMESQFPMDNDEIKGLEKGLADAPGGKYVALSDYGKGSINNRTLEMVNERSLIIDPKNKNFNNYKKCFIMTPNKKEAQEGSGHIIENDSDIIVAGKIIKKKNKCQNLLMTTGREGMVLFAANGRITHISTSARNVYDVTGAGDTVTAVLALCLEAEIDLLSSCILANFAAGIVVGQIGTASATKQELINAISTGECPQIKSW